MITVMSDSCTGCGTCVDVCPHRVLEMHGKKMSVTAEERCIECGACQLNCEDDAVVVTKGTGCLFVIVKEDILGLRGDAAQKGSSSVSSQT